MQEPNALSVVRVEQSLLLLHTFDITAAETVSPLQRSRSSLLVLQQATKPRRVANSLITSPSISPPNVFTTHDNIQNTHKSMNKIARVFSGQVTSVSSRTTHQRSAARVSRRGQPRPFPLIFCFQGKAPPRFNQGRPGCSCVH